MGDVDLTTVRGRQARYTELLGQMDFVLEWITDMHRVSPRSIAAAELVEDFTSIIVPFRATHQKLENGSLSWEDELIVELLINADGVRAEALRIIHTVPFQRSLSDGLAPS